MTLHGLICFQHDVYELGERLVSIAKFQVPDFDLLSKRPDLFSLSPSNGQADCSERSGAVGEGYLSTQRCIAFY